MDKALIQEISEAYNKGVERDAAEADAWWKALSYSDQLRAFYSVVKRIHEGDIKQQGSYRYVLYNVFEFDHDSYGLGMECGYMDLHNAIKSSAEQKIIDDYYKTKTKCSNRDESGSCPLHNLHCNYPDCENIK